MSLDLPGFDAGFFQSNGFARAIVEGGSHDHWNGYIIGTGIFEITPTITRIQTGGYELDLVARVRGASFDFPINTGKTIAIDRLHDGISRPATVITEDGRIFHDASLLRSPTEANRKRLASFLEFLTDNNRTFEEAYRQYSGEATHV